MQFTKKDINKTLRNGEQVAAYSSSGQASSQQGLSYDTVRRNFVSIEFFKRLFQAHDSTDSNNILNIDPNDMDSTITDIQFNFGAWSNYYLSALGQNSTGGGGGGGGLDWSALTTYDNDPSHFVNPLYIPIGTGLSIVNGELTATGSGSGSVTSVGLSMPTGFSVSGSPVTSSGTISVSLSSGYKLLSSGTVSTGTYTKVTVDTYGRVTSGSTLSSSDIPTLSYIPLSGSDNISGKLEPATSASYDIGASSYKWRHGYFSGTVYATTFNGNATSATSASKLTTARTLWGQSFDGSANVSGNMTDVGSISASGDNVITKASGETYFRVANNNGSVQLSINTNKGLYDSSNSRWIVGTNGTSTWIGYNTNVGIGYSTSTTPSEKLDVNGNIQCQNVIPSANSTYTLGTTSSYWSNIYSRYLYMINEGTTSEDIYSNIYMGNTDTTTNQTAYVRMRMFNDHRSNNNGLFVTYSSGDAVFGGGEGVLSLADLVRGTNTTNYENTYIAADGIIFFDAYCGTSTGGASRLGFALNRSGYVIPTSLDTYTNNAGQIGTSDYRWNYLYVKNVNASGDILASGAVTALSDMRQKSFLCNIDADMETLASLPIFYYKWKDGRDIYMHIGTSAQAVQKVFPELVLGGEELSVNYGVLGTTLGILNSRKLTDHEKEIQSLKEENKLFKERIMILEDKA